MSPADEQTPTAQGLRTRILDVVSKNGGHLASSLGAVELSMALADVFDPKVDRVVWDVGHQAYAWKLLTDRADRFDTLRQLDGLSGFPNPAESSCDAAVAGHAGVSISTALGLAAARDRRGTHEEVVAVIGDASIANGVAFEALNNAAAATKKVIVILNDNDMAISRPAGSFGRFLGRVHSGIRYNRVKAAAKKAGHALKLSFLYGPVHRFKGWLKATLLGHAWFEQFGFHYIGPVDGHDLPALKAALEVAKAEDRSVLVHVITVKGKGYRPAEKNPTKWHGTGPFKLDDSEASRTSQNPSWSDAFGQALCALARKDDRVVAITAGMKDGTGLSDFAAAFPNRFFDVGIAEEHAVAFAAGLAAAGMRPFFAVYSTFLQRAVDQAMHDVCLSKLPVVFCIDRAGVVGADGATHQGLYDLAMLRCLPNMTIAQPKDAADLETLLAEALERQGPTAIRYPRGTVPTVAASGGGDGRIALWTTGDWYGKACAVAARVPGCMPVHARYLKPFDAELLARQRAAGMRIVSLENAAVAGGLGEAIGADLRFGWPDAFIPHGTPAELEKRYGLDEDTLVAALNS